MLIKRPGRKGLQGHLYPAHTHSQDVVWPRRTVFSPDTTVRRFNGQPFAWLQIGTTLDAGWSEAHRCVFDAIQLGPIRHPPEMQL
jgi:hypothetical protein